MGMATVPYEGPPPLKWRWRRWPKFRRWMLEDNYVLVRVKCWRPDFDRGLVWWPTMLVDHRPLGRVSITPAVQWVRVLAPFRDLDES